MVVLFQVIATTIVCFPCLHMGIMYAWPSSTVLLFTSPNTTLNRPMTEMELALFGSLSSVGAMIGTLAAGVLLDRIGRKNCTILTGLISVISWTILAVASSVEVVLVAVFVSGFSGSAFLIVPVFVSEFCQESIRGTMASGSMVAYGVGMLVSYALGGYLGYRTMIYVSVAMAAFEVAAMAWIKESPVYLMKNYTEEESAKSVAFYRQDKIGSKLVMQELDTIRRALNPNIPELVPDEEKPECLEDVIYNDLQSKRKSSKFSYIETSQHKLSTWKFCKKSKPTQRGLLITTILVSSSILQGLVVVQVYAEPLFAEAVPIMPPNSCTLIFAVVIVVASVVAAYMSDLAGRRPLMIYSSLGSGICCVLLGIQLHLSWAPSYSTAIIMYIFCVVFSFGGGTVPYVLLAEVFLPEVKSFMTMLVVEWMWVCSSLLLFVFSPLSAAIGLGPVFYIFAGICFASALFSVFYLPETKGLPLDVVQTLLSTGFTSNMRWYEHYSNTRAQCGLLEGYM